MPKKDIQKINQNSHFIPTLYLWNRKCPPSNLRNSPREGAMKKLCFIEWIPNRGSGDGPLVHYSDPIEANKNLGDINNSEESHLDIFYAYFYTMCECRATDWTETGTDVISSGQDLCADHHKSARFRFVFPSFIRNWTSRTNYLFKLDNQRTIRLQSSARIIMHLFREILSYSDTDH